MIYIVTLILAWVLLFGLIALFETFVRGYRSPIDWWYCCIEKRRDRGVWYYGSPEAARRRQKL